MNIILGLFQFILIVIICFYEYNKKSSSVFMWATLLVMFSIMHLLDCFMGSSDYMTSTLNEASFFVIFFSLLYLLVRCLVHEIKSSKKENFVNEVESTPKNLLFVKILFAIFSLAIVINVVLLIVKSGGFANSSWETMRDATAVVSYFSFSQIFLTLFIATSANLILAWFLNKKWISIISIILIIIEVLVSRNRIEILPIFVMFIIVFLNRMKKINVKFILTTLVIGFTVIYAVYGLRVYRHYGSFSNFVDKASFSEFNERIFNQLKNNNGELGLRNHFYYFVENDNNFENFGKGHTYLRILMVFVPTRWSFGLKPSDFAISMGKAVSPTSQGYSVHPTLFGDCYANFGFLGCLLGIFWALFATFIDRITSTKNKIFNICVLSVSSLCYIIIARGSVYNSYIWMIFSIIFIFVMCCAYNVLYSKKIRDLFEKKITNFVNLFL